MAIFDKKCPIFFIDSAASVGGRSRARGDRGSSVKSGQERSSTANGKNRTIRPPIGDLLGSKLNLY